MDQQFYRRAYEHGFCRDPGRLRFYLEEYLFRGVPLNGRSLLDIGGGRGLFSFYAALQGASRVVVMEPEFDGSSAGMIAGFERLRELLGHPPNISLTRELLERWDREHEKFDVVLMHNSINHIDEESTVRLRHDAKARESYLTYFELLAEVTRPGSTLIICDCSNQNFWGQLFGWNPMQRTIEWQKHQPPGFWAQLLSQHGFRHVRTSWSSPNMLGQWGRLLLGNRWAAWLTYSHFRLEMVRV